MPSQPRPAAREPLTLALAIALAAAAVRLVAFSGTELYADEAYYWLWSLRPAWGYFDHPPLVAWVIAAAARVLPPDLGELAVRLPFVLLGAGTALATGLLARELALELGADRTDPDRACVMGAALGAAAPLLQLTGALALPDEPLLCAYTAGLALLARARGRRWLAAGVAVGLALLAKYTAALLAPALLLAVLWDARLRRELRTPWPWLGGLTAVALFAPCLAWNARHGWMSIRFQLDHGFGGEPSLESFAEYLGGQLAGAGPVALLVGGAALARSLGRGRGGPAWRRVALAALLPLAVTTVSALRGRVEANWPALAYPALAAAAGAVLAGARRPRLARGAVLASVALTLALLAGFATLQRHPGPFTRGAVVKRFHGWRELAAAARRATDAGCAAMGCDPAQPRILTQGYGDAAELAFYGGYRRFAPAVERPSQLDLWGRLPGPGEPFFHAGKEGPTEELLQALKPAPGGPASRLRVVLPRGGRAIERELVVTPFAGAEGVLPRPPLEAGGAGPAR